MPIVETLTKVAVYPVIGLCLVGAPATAAAFGHAIFNAAATSVGIISGSAGDIKTSVENGRKLAGVTPAPPAAAPAPAVPKPGAGGAALPAYSTHG